MKENLKAIFYFLQILFSALNFLYLYKVNQTNIYFTRYNQKMMKLSDTIIQAINNLKIESLNPMQEASIDAWKEGKDLILLSPTGSGKTLAYLLPLLESLNPEEKG